MWLKSYEILLIGLLIELEKYGSEVGKLEPFKLSVQEFYLNSVRMINHFLFIKQP